MSFISRAIDALAKAVSSVIGPPEVAFLIGLVMVGYGAGLVWLPAGIFLPGMILLYVSIFGLKA